ncbi:DNA repair protein RecO [Acholeplasma oculi]|uniref:DNA recombination and repair protein RecO n=1 Tax=Acholeplasma oculi TaxID=35623 RepID=A0A061A9M7_9MOLU|nr:DNA repair protein RecO [Acholeplasma oculi]CDR30605.1 DNA recombination and repair protein RecO [Acholeplasma oculi]SKC46412.1 DNA replication and repair protein RecO [Acholeplasma oculi]SUT89322.1 DNA repair protein RecO [Acholeplasma oculi]
MEGIIYKQHSYKENDRLIFLYTPRGKITLIAKGSQKVTSENRIIAQYLNQIEFKDQPSRDMFILQDALLINSFQAIKASYESTLNSSILFDFLQLVYDHEPHQEIYPLILNALTAYQKENVIAFGFKLLKFIGYPIDLKPTSKKVKGISIKLSRLVYDDEPEKSDISIELATHILKMTYLNYDQLETLSLEAYQHIKKFLYDYIEHHTDIKFTRK